MESKDKESQFMSYTDPYSDDSPREALGQSEIFLDFQEQLSRVARVNRPVLLVGERGTGKELAARRIHYLSKRWDAPLVELNCAALAPGLLESELFGHEAGAFTGATSKRVGRFEAADTGSLFLDELGNIPLEVQEKILRMVEYGVFGRVGGSAIIHTDVRIIGATNADLPTLVEEGRFMRDLLDRLSFEVLCIPPLRERQEDILLLAGHFANRMAMELDREELPEFSEKVVFQLEAHPWRGNVRELKNVIERAVYQAEDTIIDRIVFDPFIHARLPASTKKESPAETAPAMPTLQGNFKESVEAYECSLIRTALEQSRFHQHYAAERLGLSYNQFRGLYRKYQKNL